MSIKPLHPTWKVDRVVESHCSVVSQPSVAICSSSSTLCWLYYVGPEVVGSTVGRAQQGHQ